MACEQRMLNGGTAVDSVGLVHTRHTLSPDVCWDWLCGAMVEGHNYHNYIDN